MFTIQLLPQGGLLQTYDGIMRAEDSWYNKGSSKFQKTNMNFKYITFFY